MQIRKIALFLLMISIPSLSLAELSVEQSLSQRRLSDIQISPDGKLVALTVSQPPKGTERNSNIWIVPLSTDSTSQPRQFTTSEKSDNSPRWSPNGKRLAFLSNRNEGTQIYILSQDGGEAQQLTQGKNSIDSFEWSPDGKKIAFVAEQAKTEAEEKKEKDKDDAQVVDKDDKPKRLWTIDLESKKIDQLTSGSWSISELQWSPAGEKLFVIATDHPESVKFTDRIFAISAKGGELKQLVAPAGPFADLKISPDGKMISYTAGRSDEPITEDVYVFPAATGGQPKNLTTVEIGRAHV